MVLEVRQTLGTTVPEVLVTTARDLNLVTTAQDHRNLTLTMVPDRNLDTIPPIRLVTMVQEGHPTQDMTAPVTLTSKIRQIILTIPIHLATGLKSTPVIPAIFASSANIEVNPVPETIF